MKSRYLLCVCVFTFLCSCEEPLAPAPSERIRIESYQYGSTILFARMPVSFYARKMNSFEFSQKLTWTFGNGTTGNQDSNIQTFDFPGTYKISVTTDGGSNYADTTVVIAPPVKLIGSKAVAENGKAILKNGNSGYSVLHHTDVYSSSFSRSRLLSVSSGFDSLRSASIPLESFTNTTLAFVTRRNTIVILSSNILEIDHSGRVLKTVYPGNNWSPQQYIETADGYIIAGIEFNGTQISVAHFNNDLEKVSEASINIARESYNLHMFHLESENVLVLKYLKSYLDNNDQSGILVRKTISGEVLFEKTFTRANPINYILPLTTGYMLAGAPETSDGQRKYVFTKITFDGATQWTSLLPDESLYPQFINTSAPSIIERNNFIYIFVGNQKVKKLTTSGEEIWTKQFGFYTDTFNDVVINEAGNFIVLATHQFDFFKFEFTNDYGLRDLMLIEIDGDGNVVNR